MALLSLTIEQSTVPCLITIPLFLGDHFGVDKKKIGDHFGVGIISVAVQLSLYLEKVGVRSLLPGSQRGRKKNSASERASGSQSVVTPRAKRVGRG